MAYFLHILLNPKNVTEIVLENNNSHWWLNLFDKSGEYLLHVVKLT